MPVVTSRITTGIAYSTDATTPGIARHRHQVDERDDVDELRQRLQRVEQRPQQPLHARALRRPDADRDPDQRRRCAVATSTCEAVSIAGLPDAHDPDRSEHQERRDRRAHAAQHEGDRCEAPEHDEPRRLHEQQAQRLEEVLEDEVADRLGDAEDERGRILDVVERVLDPAEQVSWIVGRVDRGRGLELVRVDGAMLMFCRIPWYQYVLLIAK